MTNRTEINKILIDLIYVLADLYPDMASTSLLMQRVGVDSGRILNEQAPSTRWFFIVSECEKSGLIEKLLDLTLTDYPDQKDLNAIKRQLSEKQDLLSPVLPVLIAAIGAEAESATVDNSLSLDLAALRAVYTATGLAFIRIKDATFEKLRIVLNRARLNRQQVNLHLAVHSSPVGIELGGELIDAERLSEILDGVQILVLAGCQSSEIGDYLGVVPFVITMLEDVTHTDAALFSLAFWTEIGLNNTPETALRNAFKRAPSGMSEYVTHHW